MTEESLENKEETNKTKKKKPKFLETIETIVIALILAIFIRATVAEARYIPSESMVPTLLVQDRLVVEKLSNYMGTPKRGEILVFYPPKRDSVTSSGVVNGVAKEDYESLISRTYLWLGFTTKVAYIKRVVGLPGETLEVKNGTVFINGQPLQEDYINEKPYYDYGPIKIKDDELFMMGDNRNNSLDSHAWGPLPIQNVIGHAVIRFWPPKRIGTIK